MAPAASLRQLRDQWASLAATLRSRRLDVAREVSVVIPSAGTHDAFGAALLEGALELIRGQAPVYVAVTNHRITPEGADACARHRATIVEVDSPEGFNFSRAINVGVHATATPHVLLLNDDVRGPVHPGWLGWWLRQDAELSAPALRWPDGRTAYAGIAWEAPGRMPNHQFLGVDPATLPPEPETLAVTGAALLVSRELFDRVGGFSEELPLNYNDIDFCLQALAIGVQPRQFNQIVLTHEESASRGHTPPTVEDYRRFVARCAPALVPHGIALSADEAITVNLLDVSDEIGDAAQ